jgi:ABC-type dipeptide/oligopeptide/nickel transport system permease component
MFGLFVLVALIYLTYLGLAMAGGESLGPALALAAAKSTIYLSDFLQGDLGQTAAGTFTGNPALVSEILLELVSRSFGLLAVSLTMATVVGVLLGLLAAQHRHAQWSVLVIAISVIGISVPSFFAAPLLQMLMVQWTRIFGQPLLPLGGFGWDQRLILPALVLAARPIAQITRVTYVSLGEVMAHDYVRVAYSKGLRSHAVLWRHIGPNISIPVLTTIGLSLRFSLSSLPVVEFFFGWHGMGYALLKAIAHQDDRLIIALLLTLAVGLILLNLILELVYRRIDPRLRQPAQRVNRRRNESAITRFKEFLADLTQILADNPLHRRLTRTRKADVQLPIGNSSATELPAADSRIAAERRRVLLRSTLGNIPFMIGGLIILGLLGLVFFGPRLAPHNPYTTQGLVIENGQFSVPPFAPDSTFPWGTDVLGRDLMSLILSGAQQTLLVAAVVVLVRMALGALLGLLAGWQQGTWLDRFLLALTEIIASVPTLLLAMILIVALGIQQGMRPFIIALCIVGWGEVMQFVRGQVVSLRPRLFIESAIATGLRMPRIIVGHLLPNLLPALISIAALEMGAVLILLGELGFIGIFIGGGSLAEVTGVGVYHYSDVPEWGALLSNLRTYARAYSWMAIYPTTAFFVAILGFNLFGEGVRQLVDNVGVRITGVINRYTVTTVIIVLVGISWAQQNTGLRVFYRQQANSFSGENALAYIHTLTDPVFEGRALGSSGLAATTDYLVSQFEALGLQSAGQKNSYLYERTRSYEQLNTVPQLAIFDGGPSLVYHRDFSTLPNLFRNLGQAEGQVRVISTGPLNQSPNYLGPPTALRRKNYADEVLLVLSAREAANLSQVPHAGILVVAQDEAEVQRNQTLHTREVSFSLSSTGRRTGQDVPRLLITEAAANRILRETGLTVADLRLSADSLLEDQIIDIETRVAVSMRVDGTIIPKTPTAHVLGFIPGTAGLSERTGQLNSNLIMVIAPYDSPPRDVDGLFRPAANSSASGVAIMLETMRTIQESGYEPYKTLLFVAYSSEGLEGGEVVSTPDPGKLLQARSSFVNNVNLEAVVHLRGLGAGSGDKLALTTSGSQRLAGLFESAAHQIGVNTTRVDEGMDLRLVFENAARGRGQDAPQIGLSWQGWESDRGTSHDTPDKISASKLEEAGRTLSLALMILGRETEY